MRENDWAFLKALPYAIVVWICLTVVGDSISDQDTAYLAVGCSCLPSVGPSLSG